MGGAAPTVGLVILSGLQVQVGAIYRTQEPGRDSSLKVTSWPEGMYNLTSLAAAARFQSM